MEHKNYIKNVIKNVIDKYSKRDNNFVTLTSIIGDFSNNILLRAIRNVMFERLEVYVFNKKTSISNKRTMWLLKNYGYNYIDDGKDDNYITFMTKMVYEEKLKLYKLLKKNK